MKYHAVLLALLTTTSLLQAQPEAGQQRASDNEKRPNIVFMMADNLGYGDLGVYGGGENRGMPTPYIDRLASEGIRFDQFLVEPSCAPTRAAVLTGRYSIRSLLSGRAMQSSEITLAELLKTVGYSTAAYGKWHLGWKEDQQPQSQGFDEFFGVETAAGKILYPSSMRSQGIEPDEAANQYIWEVKDGKMVAVGPYDEQTRRVVDEQMAERAIAYIDKYADEETPFFIYLAWTRVHYPNYPSEEFEGKSRIGIYGDSVMELDDNTGKVLRAIKEAGIEDDTIVIWISDNGPMRTAVWPDGGFQGPYRGDIGSPLEGSIRTAGMIKWPGHFDPGVTHEMFSAMDFLPTLARFAGVAVPNDRPIDGLDQSEFLLNYQSPGLENGSSQVRSARDSLLTFIDGELSALRWKQFRIYFSNYLPQEGFMAIEGSSSMIAANISPVIYNIERDPRELVDTANHNGWILPKAMHSVREYVDSLTENPNPTVTYPTRIPMELFLRDYRDKAKAN
jgi:arylsulfatase